MRQRLSDVASQILKDIKKWNITRNEKPVSKEQFQSWWYQRHPYGGTSMPHRIKVDKCDFRKLRAYFPDITNPTFQDLLLSWAKKQIDCGADGVCKFNPRIWLVTDNPDIVPRALPRDGLAFAWHNLLPLLTNKCANAHLQRRRERYLFKVLFSFRLTAHASPAYQGRRMHLRKENAGAPAGGGEGDEGTDAPAIHILPPSGLISSTLRLLRRKVSSEWAKAGMK